MRKYEATMTEARVEMEFIKLTYLDYDEHPKVCYLLATNHYCDSDVIRTMRDMDPTKIFEIY